MPIYLYIIKRILIAIPTLLIISFISFTFMRYDFTIGPFDLNVGSHHVHIYQHIKTPRDPLAEMRQNPQISKAAIIQEEQRLGLDKPFMVQYWLWLTNVLHFDTHALKTGHLWAVYQPNFGKSFSGEDVTSLLKQRIPNTLMLNISVLLATWLIAIPLGIYAALHWRSKMDTALTVFSSVGMSAPTFVVALLLALFAVQTGWFPVGGITSDNFDTFHWWQKILDVGAHLVLPVTVMTIVSIAGLQRQMRGNLLDVLEAEYVRVARAKGLPENQVIYKHAVRTAINPMVTLMGYEMAALLSGSAVVEMVLRFPGLGYLMYDAILQTDTNLVMISLVLAATMLLAGNLFADILLKVVDPRIELE